MGPSDLISLASPATCLVAAGLFAAAAASAYLRRPAVPRATLALAGAGCVLLCLAAGGPAWRGRAPEPVVVMVDLSPSTRTATYRDPASLRARLDQLLGATPYRVVSFAGADTRAEPVDPNGRSPLPDRPARSTVFSPPAGSAVVLLSDARFDLPAAAPPTYVVVDPALESPADAAVRRLEVRSSEVAATTGNAGGVRELTFSGAAAPVPVPQGSVVLTQPLPDRGQTATIVARLSPGDAWPENDSLAIVPPPPVRAQRWWVGGPAPDTTWRSLAAEQLPTDPAEYLLPSVVVLDNVPADALKATQAQRLTQYVRDLGGGLLLCGGDRAFAAGGYPGTALETLSSLASTPPEPTAHWVLLVDSSGSMNAPAGGTAAAETSSGGTSSGGTSSGGTSSGGTRWQAAVGAAAALLRALPPGDLASVGSFAAQVSWWTRGGRAADVAKSPLPPPGAAPSGPTELRRAIEDVTASAETSPPTQLVLLTDGNADLGDVAALSESMRGRGVRLHLLAIGEGDGGAGLAALRRLVADTGGSLARERDPSRWAAAARELLRAAAPRRLEASPARVEFVNGLRGLPPRQVAPWNRTWLKDGATVLAEARPSEGGQAPTAGRWAVGEGAVAAVAFPASALAPEERDAAVDLVARPPRDPRLRVTWDAGGRLAVRVDAVDGGRYLNGLALTLELSDPAAPGAPGRTAPIPQAGPGRYELAVDAPASPVFAAVRHDRRVADRAAVAGRYPAEFDAIGNDRARMHELAGRSGGKVVGPDDDGPLDLPRPPRAVPLTSPLAAAGAVLVALGLIRWRAS